MSQFIYRIEGGWRNLHYMLATCVAYGSLIAITAGFSAVAFIFVGWHLASFIVAPIYGLMIAVDGLIIFTCSRRRRLDLLRKLAMGGLRVK